MSQTPASRSSAPAPGCEGARLLAPPGANAPIDPAQSPTDGRALSWRDAMARAEEGEGAAVPARLPGGETASDPAHAPSSGQTNAAAGEWSPMNPRGSVSANGGQGAGLPGAQAPAADGRGAGGTDGAFGGGPALDGAQGLVDGAAHMNPEELLQLKRDRLAMGLEPEGLSGQALLSEQDMGFNGPLDPSTQVNLAQPVSLLQPQGIGVHSLPESERAVVNGMTVSELVVERQVDDEHSDEQAQAAGAEVASTQAHLAEVNTPDSLPLETIQST